MVGTFDFEKEYGLVLEGGGAKGAYQIGVWKALKECNVKIKGIAGVSVGALNGALICMNDLELAEKIWNNITYSQVMDVDDEDMKNLMQHDIKNIKLKRLTITSAKAVTSGGFDISPLKNLIDVYLDEKKIRECPMELIMGTLSLKDLKEIEIVAKELAEGEIKNFLIASASLPLFKQEKLQGKTYLDGGMVNNVPIDMLLKRDYKDIIVVRIFGIGVERKVKIPEGVKILEIAPRVELGNILEFDPHKAQRNIRIGYFDAMRVLKNLKGKIYYIDSMASEAEYFQKLCNLNAAVQMAFLEYFKESYEDGNLYLRKMVEIVFPAIAEKLGLPKNWTYSQLYLSMLELSAKALKVQKYRVYTEEAFCSEIRQNYMKYGEPEKKVDLFIQLIVKAMAID